MPIYKAAVNIILVHNLRLTGRGRHPSGSLTPSPANKDFTDKMMKVGKLLNVTVVDHQIITETSFYSFANAGLMKELAKSGLYEVTHKESEEMKTWREEELAKRAKDERSREMAAKMLADGLDVDTVVKYSGLRKSSVEKMRREVGK